MTYFSTAITEPEQSLPAIQLTVPRFTICDKNGPPSLGLSLGQFGAKSAEKNICPKFWRFEAILNKYLKEESFGKNLESQISEKD
jgi:hypothetical protein